MDLPFPLYVPILFSLYLYLSLSLSLPSCYLSVHRFHVAVVLLSTPPLFHHTPSLHIDIFYAPLPPSPPPFPPLSPHPTRSFPGREKYVDHSVTSCNDIIFSPWGLSRFPSSFSSFKQTKKNFGLQQEGGRVELTDGNCNFLYNIKWRKTNLNLSIYIFFFFYISHN